MKTCCEKSWSNWGKKIRFWAPEKKKKRGLKRVLPETARKIDFLKRYGKRNHEVIEAQQIRFWASTKWTKKRKTNKNKKTKKIKKNEEQWRNMKKNDQFVFSFFLFWCPLRASKNFFHNKQDCTIELMFGPFVQFSSFRLLPDVKIDVNRTIWITFFWTLADFCLVFRSLRWVGSNQNVSDAAMRMIFLGHALPATVCANEPQTPKNPYEDWNPELKLGRRHGLIDVCTFDRALRQWRRGACRSDYNTTSAGLSVTWKIQREVDAKTIRQHLSPTCYAWVNAQRQLSLKHFKEGTHLLPTFWRKHKKKQRGTNKMKESPHPVKAQKCSNCTKIQRTQTSQLNS